MDVIERFEARASQDPDATAVVGPGGERIPYGHLDAEADRLAAALLDAGVGPGSVVGLCMTRRPPAVAVMLAVLKAGAAFMPLDVSHPPDRIGTMVRTAATYCVVTERDVASALEQCPPPLPVLFHDELEPSTRPLPSGKRALPAHSLRCVIFTSGSTGRPKGIGMGSATIENVADWALRSADGPTVCLQFSLSLIHI